MRGGCVLGLAALLLAACAPTQVPPNGSVPPGQTGPVVLVPPAQMASGARPALGPDGMLRVGLLLPQSGSAAAAGNAMLNAARLAVETACPARVAVTPFDTQGTAEGAAVAANQALASGASVLLGPLLTAETEAVSPLAAAAGVPVLAFTNDRRRAGGSTWVLGALPQVEVARVIGWARDQGATRIAVLVPDNAGGQAVLEAARAETARLGVALVREATYPPGGAPVAGVQAVTDFGSRYGAIEAEIRRLRQEDSRDARARIAELQKRQPPPPPYDAILLADQGERLQLVSSLLAYHFGGRGDARLLGTALVGQDRAAWDEGSLAGTVFAGPDPTQREAFAAAYAQRNGGQPGALAAIAHQAVELVCTIAREDAPNLSPASLARAEGFAVTAGPVRLLPDGTSARPLALFKIQRGSVEVVEPAPAVGALPGT